MNTNEPSILDRLDPAIAQAMPAPEPEGYRLRGGQPGNQNARKHGFYATFFTPEEQAALQLADTIKDLTPEIALMRVRLMNLITHPNASEETVIRAVRAITRMIDVQDRITFH